MSNQDKEVALNYIMVQVSENVLDGFWRETLDFRDVGMWFRGKCIEGKSRLRDSDSIMITISLGRK